MAVLCKMLFEEVIGETNLLAHRPKKMELSQRVCFLPHLMKADEAEN